VRQSAASRYRFQVQGSMAESISPDSPMEPSKWPMRPLNGMEGSLKLPAMVARESSEHETA